MAMSWAGALGSGRGNVTHSGKSTMVRPLFIKLRDLPRKEDFYTTFAMCSACEEVSGYESMEGAQLISGLWRLYPANTAARDTLLLSGISVEGIHVTLSDTNPFIVSANGQEIKTTRVCISDIPLSYNNTDIELVLKKLGCTLMSDIKYECDRHEDKLTRFKNGRRFVYISVPEKPLPKQIRVGLFTAKLYHREQPRESRKDTRCFNCNELNHFQWECPHPKAATHSANGGRSDTVVSDPALTELGQGSETQPGNQAGSEAGQSPAESSVTVSVAAESADSLALQPAEKAVITVALSESKKSSTSAAKTSQTKIETHFKKGSGKRELSSPDNTVEPKKCITDDNSDTENSIEIEEDKSVNICDTGGCGETPV